MLQLNHSYSFSVIAIGNITNNEIPSETISTKEITLSKDNSISNTDTKNAF